MNLETYAVYIMRRSIYDSRNFNELGNYAVYIMRPFIYDSRNFNELGNRRFCLCFGLNLRQ